MSEAKAALPTSNVEVLLALLERGARELHTLIVNPPQQFPVEALRSHVARLYSYTDELVNMAEAARAKAQADAEANGAAPAEQVN
ncbi:MAG TPA: hypothetical protein VHE81_06635 [Lacipirellulaceae bacterium]|jgi:hypothetical protein|nr:hypothetical protein [Lacipirellulaceae bacterium]